MDIEELGEQNMEMMREMESKGIPFDMITAVSIRVDMITALMVQLGIVTEEELNYVWVHSLNDYLKSTIATVNAIDEESNG